jgi:two-component system chemotaxis family response regulator WspR
VHVLSALLIDHDAAGIASVREALADAGCLDIETVSAEQALQLVASGETGFDLVVIAMTPREAACLRVLRAGWRELPILATCDARDVELAFQSGATECVTLPVRTRELTARVRAALRSRVEARRRHQRERKMSDALRALIREKHDLERLACVDSLTGVANRRHALALLDAEWKRSARERLSVGLVMIDLDCYHAYNERYGHVEGDACLQKVADAMVRCLRRPSDFLGRYGGEEFVAVLPNTDAVGAKIVTERLRAAVEALGIPHVASACARVVTITAGFAALVGDAEVPVSRVIGAADAALLRAKSRGRNRIDGDAPPARSLRISAQRWQRYEPVYVDPWYADRIAGYLDSVHEKARALLDELALELPAQWEPALASPAGEVGLPMIDGHIAEIQRALASGEEAAARRAIDALIQYVTHVQVIYRRPLQQTG